MLDVLLDVFWIPWICGLMSVINIGKFSESITSNISSVPFWLYLVLFPLYLCYTFCNCPTVLEYSIPYLTLFFTLWFSAWDISNKIPLRWLTFSQLCSFFWWVHQNSDFCIFLFLAFSFDSFLEFAYFCLYYPLVLAHFSIRFHSILIILLILWGCHNKTPYFFWIPSPWLVSGHLLPVYSHGLLFVYTIFYFSFLIRTAVILD